MCLLKRNHVAINAVKPILICPLNIPHHLIALKWKFYRLQHTKEQNKTNHPSLI